MSWVERSGLKPYTFTFVDGTETFERVFYESSEVKARNLAQAWAARQGYRLVEPAKV